MSAAWADVSVSRVGTQIGHLVAMASPLVGMCGRTGVHASADGRAQPRVTDRLSRAEDFGRSGWPLGLDVSFIRAGRACSFVSAPNRSVSQVCSEGWFVTVTLEVDDLATRNVIEADAVSQQDRRDVDVDFIDQIEA
jgi:hypothetical protein